RAGSGHGPAAAAVRLGAEEGLVGGVEHAGGRLSGPADGEPDGGTDGRVFVTDGDGLADGVDDPLGGGGGVALIRAWCTEDGELVATEAGDGGFGRSGLGDACRRLPEHGVAG